MKYIAVSWTYLDTIEVPDDVTPDDIENILDHHEEHDSSKTWNDREWSWVND